MYPLVDANLGSLFEHAVPWVAHLPKLLSGTFERNRNVGPSVDNGVLVVAGEPDKFEFGREYLLNYSVKVNEVLPDQSISCWANELRR